MKFWQQYRAFLVCLIILVITSWTLLKPGFFRVHDFTHAARIHEMKLGLMAGHFPVRWSQNFGYGYGMPLFEFYAPLPFLFGALVSFAGLPLEYVLKLLWLIPSLVTVIMTYHLGKKVWGEAEGLVLAAVVTLAPYRAVNLFVRGAVSELWAMMSFPIIAYGLIMMIKRERFGWVWLWCGLSILFLSHNLMTLLFLPFSVALGAVLLLQEWLRQPKKPQLLVLARTVGEIALTYLAAMGTAAFYLFPALVEKDLTKVGAIFSGYFYFGNHFVFIRQLWQDTWQYGGSSFGPEDGISFFLGWGQIGLLIVMLGVGLFLAWTFFQAFKQSDQRRYRAASLLTLGLWGGLWLLAQLMSLGRSLVIWEAIPLLEVVQFPWRWLGVSSFILGLLGAASLAVITYSKLKWIVVTMVIALSLITSVRYFKPEAQLADLNEYYYLDSQRIRSEMSETLNDYIPKQVVLNPDSKLDPATWVARGLASSSAKVTVVREVPHYKELLVETLPASQSAQPTQLELAVADFPGWQVRIDDKTTPHLQTPQGLIMVELPASTGRYKVEALFAATPVRFWSDMLSMFSLAGVVGALMLSSRRKKNTPYL